LLSVFVIACGNPPKTEPEHPTPSPEPGLPTTNGTSGPIGPGVGQGVVKSGARKVRVEAPHGGAIALLATSADGKTVATVDELGGTRLWTALDGSAEPRVVDFPRPTELVVGPHAKGYSLAMIDSVGGLVVQLVDKDGITLQRASLPIEPAYGGVGGVTDKGVLAWRVDQRLTLIAPDTGAILGELPTEAGQRMVALTANSDRAVAVIESSTTTKARWITLSPQLAWGAWIEGADDLGPNITISPSGKRIASLIASASRGITVEVIDTASGKLVANEPASGANAIALPSDDYVALGITNGVSWIDLSKVKSRAAPNPKSPPPQTPPERYGLVLHEQELGKSVPEAVAQLRMMISPRRSLS